MDFNYPPELPMTGRRGEIIAAMKSNAVVIVCGDTGSGKTTQLPKMLLEIGRGAKGRRIACTQPRRIAAVTMAERVAEELGGQVGGLVGYQHRFGRKLSDDTRVKFMTDGVLLAETRDDPLLRRYDAIIVDEAHERSLNVDFLLGILKRILAKRKDLKVIVSSATLDAARFSEFFGNAPVVSVPGRLFPIEVRWRPPQDEEERDLPREIADAVRELPASGDILVFLPGERDIRETADRLASTQPSDDIIPLLASLPASEQQRAFRTSPRRRIILATNVAETSVTIPGIRAVIDSGLARISRYIHRTQIQRLQIESISQASARQRAGRCGRLGPGICIRLYSEEDFNSRDAYTPPEVLRSSLAGVILTMLDLRLGDIACFPFLEPPKPAMIREGLRELLELGAIVEGADAAPALTSVGRKLARIPAEPRLARMLLAAADNATLPSAMILVAAMSCDDPRRRPMEEKEKADQAHAPFRKPGSDFLGTLALWNWWDVQTKDLSQSKARALAKKTFLSYPRMREWRDLVRQLEQLCRRLDLSFAETAGRTDEEKSAALHRSLLAGLLGRIGRYDPEERDWRGAYGLRFAIHPSSSLARKQRRKEDPPPDVVNAHRKQPKDKPSAPQWIMAGELVDTSRLFARNAAEIDPRWIEPVAGPLCRHSYHSPEWDPASGFVRAVEQVTLHGLVIVPARRCDFSRVNPSLAREMFIRRGIVNGEFPTPPPELRHNLAVLDELRRRAERTRRPELFDADGLCAHFADAIPQNVASAPALKRWLRRASPDELARFNLKKEDWLPPKDATPSDFPSTIRIGRATLHLSYRHTPDDPSADGITCSVKRSDAPALRLWPADWLVPGALPEKLAYFLNTLPKSIRRALPSTDDAVATLLAHLSPGSEPLLDALRRTVDEYWGIRIPPDAWGGINIPPHFHVRYLIRDDATGRPVALSRDLSAALAAAGVPESSGVAADAVMPRHAAAPSSSSSVWTFGVIPEESIPAKGGWKVRSYPALHFSGDEFSVRIFPDKTTAAAVHSAAAARLFLRAIGKEARPQRLNLPLKASLHLGVIGYDASSAAADIVLGAVKEAFVRDLPPVRDADSFERRLRERLPFLAQAKAEITRTFGEALAAAAELSDRISATRIPPETAASMRAQLAWLVFPGFPANVPLARLCHYARYMKGAAVRLERARNNPSSDLSKEALFAPHWNRYRAVAAGDGRAGCDAAALEAYRWLAEEYRISLFAQELHTAEPVSPKRLDALWAKAVPEKFR
jgi:ATP-dependent helicase HrpA